VNTIDHMILSSVKEFIDYNMLSSIGAFATEELPLYRDENDDEMGPNYTLYSSSRQQWVYDESIAGAIVPDGVMHSGGILHRGDNGLRIDYKNGRAVFDQNTVVTDPRVMTSYKLFNSYVTGTIDNELYMNTLFDMSPEYFKADKPLLSNSFIGPCYFVKIHQTSNEGFAFGGLDKTIFNVKILILARSEYEFVSMGSVLRDLKYKNFKILQSTPLDEFGDTKTIPWNYRQAPSIGAAIIEDSTMIRIETESLNNENPHIFPGVCNLKLFFARYPRL